MALFGKKQGANAAPSTGDDAGAPDANAFDFDAISRDLDAQNGGASSFDDLLGQPVAPVLKGETPKENSAFDFPGDVGLDENPSGERDELDFSQKTPAPRAIPTHVEQMTPQNDPFGLLADGTPVLAASDEARKPVVMTNANPVLAGEDTDFQSKTRKSPLMPVLGGLVALALVGAGTYSFMKSQNGAENEAPVSPITQMRDERTPAPSETANAPKMAAVVEPTVVATTAPAIKKPVAIITKPTASAKIIVVKPTLQPPATTGANPGISDAPVRVLPANPANPIRVKKGPLPLTPEVQERLKTLWKIGAAAKKRGDFEGARMAWREALRVRPGHPGFQESIDKLPR